MVTSHTGCLSIHGTHVTANIGCFNIHGAHVTANVEFLYINGTHVTANTSTNNNFVFFFVSDLKIVYDNHNESSITVPRTRDEKYFASPLGLENWGSIPDRVKPKTQKR